MDIVIYHIDQRTYIYQELVILISWIGRDYNSHIGQSETAIYTNFANSVPNKEAYIYISTKLYIN